MSTKKNFEKRQKSTTMHDVARLAGVSQATVSRVLNNSDTSIAISAETRSKVLAAIEELGYRPNMHARSLRSQKTQMIAVLIADLSNGYYHSIVHAIQAVARAHKYDVIIAASDHLYENEKHFFEAMSRRPVDGIIMRAVHISADYLDQFISRTNTPLAVLGYQIEHPQIDTVYSNDAQAVYEATRWLIDERGFVDLGFIGVPDNLPPGPRRFQGFKNALQESNIPVRPEYIVTGDFTLESGKRAAQQLIDQGTVPSVLIAMNDLMAIGAMLVLQDNGYKVPEDVGIVGYDDIAEATIVRPKLTTIAQDATDIGHKLATLVFDRIENPELPNRRLISQNQLIIRQSV